MMRMNEIISGFEDAVGAWSISSLRIIERDRIFVVWITDWTFSDFAMCVQAVEQ